VLAVCREAEDIDLFQSLDVRPLPSAKPPTSGWADPTDPVLAGDPEASRIDQKRGEPLDPPIRRHVGQALFIEMGGVLHGSGGRLLAA
jgi:hypothetical protein